MVAHKVGHEAAAGAWELITKLAPHNDNTPEYDKIKSILVAHHDRVCKKYDMCPKGHVVFRNFKHDRLKHMEYSELDRCPVCNEDRYVSAGGERRPARVMYFFPLRHYLRSMFCMSDLTPYLCTESSHGKSALRSTQGWEHKVTRNPKMNRDSRNQPLIGATDGAPFFKDRNASGGWPFIMKAAALPESLRNDPAYSHLHALVPSVVLEAEAGEFVKKKRFIVEHTIYKLTYLLTYVVLLTYTLTY